MVSSGGETESLAPTGGDATDARAVGAPLLRGETIGRYQVRRLIGAGGMGRVYLARDVALGRSVALKLVSTSHVDRSLDEARAIALLNHPHIVQLYDFGEFSGGLFLALEYVGGETLRDRMKRGALGVDEALRCIHAIAEALDHAHHAGVVHCDLKPSNIMFGKDGRLRVLDFGIARTSGDTKPLAGTPGWMAPEQARRGPVDGAADVWALGVIAAELMTGSYPLRDGAIDDLTGIPEGIERMIRRSLEREPRSRPSARQWLAVVDAIQRGHSEQLSDEGPFPGLAAFGEQHVTLFFGRETAVDEFLERLRESPLLPIAGASGAGKSSFMFAGVIPRLRSIEPWTVIALRPGPDPIGALARQLTVATGTAESVRAASARLRAELFETPTLLAARCATLASTERCRVLIAIDQLEEVFTHGCAALERERFLAMLRAAADDPDDPTRVVVTVRDDFVGQLVGVRSLFVLQGMTPSDLRRVIAKPLERASYDVDDPTLIDDLVEELATAGGADLPMLQFACRTLWEGRDRATRMIRRETYAAMGGMAGALARHAERAIAEMSPAERRAARGLLLQLVEGSTRRSVARADLVASAPDTASAEHVLARLVTARLLVQRTADDGDVAMIEIAHESLLVNWAQLERWIDESKDERRVLEELEAATSLWERRGERVEETWSSIDIANARRRIAQLDLGLPLRLERFLSAGDRRHRRARRRRLWAFALALAAAVAIAIPATLLTSRYLAREQLIESNAGTIELVLQPYDWIGGRMVVVPAAELPELSWSLHHASTEDPHVPGARIDDVEHLGGRREGTALIERARAAGGLVFLAVDGRGRSGEHCGRSWIRVQAFPGYVAGYVERLTIEVPTCRASATSTLPVPAGPFIYGGPGDPASRHYGEPDYTRPEVEIDLPRFSMDRTEVSNALFSPFARLASVTGYPPPVYGNATIHLHDAEPDYPVSALNSVQAAAFCRYMGKSLPADQEWVKAARGGLTIAGEKNPAPRRAFPWGTTFSSNCVNQDGNGDPDPWVSPVDSYECGAGPYGHLNLVGNIDEWIEGPDRPWAVIRGGSVRSPPGLGHTTTMFINHRNPMMFDYTIGMRCVSRD